MSKKKTSLEERLKNYPHLHKRFESLMDIVEDAGGDLDKANDAEERVIEEINQLGREALQGWAEDKEAAKARQFRETNESLKNKGKKKSIGIRFLET